MFATNVFICEVHSLQHGSSLLSHLSVELVHQPSGKKWADLPHVLAVFVSGCGTTNPSAVGSFSICGDGFVLVLWHLEPSRSIA